jgi:glycosyltransferase involved in cell wall biosynthesis
LNLDTAIIEVGYIPHHQVSQLYSAADLFVFPSFTESFGHPMVEAMATGLPIVASGTEVNREVCGSAGRYFETFNAEDCAQAILEVIDRKEREGAMKQSSLERGRQFSWKRYAEQFIAVLESTAALR